MRRSEKYRARETNRYWWYRLRDTNYVPPVLACLDERDWAVLDAWFDDTDRKFENPGEISIPGISMLCGLIGGNGISAIVQCGHYVGYSTLILGFLLRSMKKTHALLSIDIDAAATAYTQSWLERAELLDVVRLHTSSSVAAGLPETAKHYFGRTPQMVFIDSSHQFAHTQAELDLWYGTLAPGGLLALHDVSMFARQYDPTQAGGVLTAAEQWIAGKPASMLMLNRHVDGTQALDDLVYKDGCGLGIVQKPIAPL